MQIPSGTLRTGSCTGNVSTRAKHLVMTAAPITSGHGAGFTTSITEVGRPTAERRQKSGYRAKLIKGKGHPSMKRLLAVSALALIAAASSSKAYSREFNQQTIFEVARGRASESAEEKRKKEKERCLAVAEVAQKLLYQ